MQYLKKEIKDNILAAAVVEFKEHGYADASIRNIANNAEISLGNIYRYFSNKEDLYFAVINPFLNSIRQVIEHDIVFENKDMREAAEVLVEFLVDHSDELLIIRKGNSVHYETFIGYIVESISKKVREMLERSFPEINEKIKNPEFYNAIAEGFLTSLFKVLSKDAPLDVQKRNVRELITFYFGHMIDRFYHFEEE
ncbi:MAG: TetR/AcrR family transcriptional regulator [Candidatus Fimimonas sp.]